MPYLFPPMLEQLVREELASGEYGSEDDVLLEAMRSLRERNETIAAIREGLADTEAGRVFPLEEVDAEMREKYQISHDV
jgi:predicted transcriptional regulator